MAIACAERGIQVRVPRIRTIVRLYLRFIERTGRLCDEALLERRRILQSFSCRMGASPVCRCRPFHLSDWIEEHAAWKSSSTRQSKASAIKACFNWALCQQRVAANPFAAVSYEETGPRQPMDDETLARLVRSASNPLARALRFLRLTGCRVSELCGMVTGDVDLKAGTVILTRHKARRRTRRQRTIVLVREAIRLVRDTRRSRITPETPVFRNTQGKAWTRRSLGQALRRLKCKTGIRTPATLHGIRHQFGTVAVRQGAPIKLVSLQMGHSSVLVTERYYLHLDREVDAIRKAVEAGLPKAFK